MRVCFNILLLLCFTVQVCGQVFYGTTRAGGANGGGTIFRMNLDGSGLIKEFEFSIDGPQGRNGDYGQMLQLANGKMYGVFPNGGLTDQGVLYEYDPATNIYTKKVDFGVVSLGFAPDARLAAAPNGKLYGTASGGGAHYNGTIFEYDPVTGAIVKKADFENATTGSLIFGGLLLAANNKFYGMAFNGGANNMGTLYEYDYVNNILTTKIEFNGNNGGLPLRDLTACTCNNKLYGLTLTGGANGSGVILEYDPATGIFTTRYDFTGAADGGNPIGSLVELGGKFYGTTTSGGANSVGTIFEFDPGSGVVVTKEDFDRIPKGTGGLNILTVAGGKLYGTTEGGGAHEAGVLFEYAPGTDVFIKHVDFDETSGYVPKSGLALASNGKLYGTTAYGGLGESGTIFEFNPASNTLTKKLDLNIATNGGYPLSSTLCQFTNGKLYGLTHHGGSMGWGVLFEFDPISKTFTNKMEFIDSSTGANPEGSLVLHPSGKMYALMRDGGAHSQGTLVEYDPVTNILVAKVNFDGVAKGRVPFGGLTLAPNGKYYGMTGYGGVSDMGVLFEYDPATEAFAKKIDFTGPNGREPRGDLLVAGGKLYGMTKLGGTDNNGTLFEYDMASTLTVKVDFKAPISGSDPFGSLVQGADGMLYGLTSAGGSGADGVLFRYDPVTQQYSKLFDFDFEAEPGGGGPRGSLALGAGNKLYGFTTYGGWSGGGYGIIFEYDPATATLTKKHELDAATGVNPTYGGLSVVAVPPVISSFTPVSGAVGSTVTITGANFSPSPSQNIVRFGPVRATVNAATPTQLTVVVPQGAEGGPISVTVSNLTATSRTSFHPTYAFNGWIPGSFYAKQDLPGGTQDKRSTIADLDGDGLADVIQISEGPAVVHIYRNTSTASSMSFAPKVDVTISAPGYSVAVADLDGDGKLDIVAACGVLSVLRNTSTPGTISFAPHHDIGSAMLSTAIADFDDDGRPDVVGGGGTSVNVFKNHSFPGTLSFSVPNTFTSGVAGSEVWKIAVGDIDGDGKVDIAVPAQAAAAASTINVFRNETNPGTIDGSSFGEPVHYATPGYTSGVDLGDLDGDGKPELIAGSSVDFATVVVRKNTATPGTIDAATFGPAINLNVQKQVWDPKVADVDGDAKPDIICGITGNGTIVILKNEISGAIGASSFSKYSLVTEGSPLSFHVADMNTDGLPDLIVSNEGLNKISIYKNQNALPPPTITSFAPASGPAGSSVVITGTHFSTVPSSNSVYFGAAKAPVTAASANSLTVTVPAGATNFPISVGTNGMVAYSARPFATTFATSGVLDASSFAPRIDVATGATPQIFTIGDFDIDGKADVAVANIDAGSMSVMRNTSTAGSVSLSKFDFVTGSQPYGIVSGDDGDGKLAILVANIGSQTVSIFKNTATSGTIGAGSFAPKTDLPAGGDAFSIAFGDFDLDGEGDHIFTKLNGSITINKTVPGQSPISLTYSGPPGWMPSHVSTGDLDGDGKPDLVVSNIASGSTAISIFRNANEIGSLAWDMFQKVDLTVGTRPYSTWLADLDADGKLDIVVANNTSGTVSVLKNKISAPGPITSASFDAKVDFAVGTGPNLVTVADVDGDLKPEIITSNDGSGTISVLKNLMTTGAAVTASSFQAKVDFTVGAAPRSVGVADMDGDNKPDILATSATGNFISILRNINALQPPVINPVEQISATGFKIVWSVVAAATTYRVDISSDNFATTVAGYGNVTVSGTSLTPAGLTPGTTYKFRVRSANVTGESANSIETSVLTLPAAPVISPTELITTTGFKLVWTAPLSATSYRVDISSDNFATMVTGYDNLPVSATSLTVTGLTAGTTYKFRVRAFNASGGSANSVETTVVTVPSPPVAAAATTITQTGFTANWAASAGSTEYRLDVSADDFGTSLAGFNNLLVSGLSQPVTGLAAGTTYKYRVRAGNASGVSANSNVITVNTTPALPGITSFLPLAGNIGTVVTITGTNFDPVLANNTVRFNGTLATVTSDVTVTSIKATVPTGATTGKITITVAGQVATSAADFVVDTTPPQIQNNTATTVTAGQALAVSGTMTDPQSGITAYSLTYASLSSPGTMTTGTLTKTGDSFSGSIPPASIGENGVEYVVTATNGVGLTSIVTATAQVHTTGNGLKIPYSAFGSGQESYRLISVPLDLDNKTVQAVFEDDLGKSTKKNWRLTRYGADADTELTSTSPVEPALGYWLIVKEDPKVDIDTGPGKSVATTRNAPVEIPLINGWNQIGNPYNFNIVWAEVLAANPGVVLASSLRVYEGTWKDALIFGKMEGAFVRSNSSQVLKIPVTRNASANGGRTFEPVVTQNPISDENWKLYIRLSQGKRTNWISGIGMNKNASEGFDTHDGFTMPRLFEHYLEVNHSKRHGNESYSFDVVPTAGSHTWEFVVATNYEDDLLQLHWDNTAFGINDKTLVLWDEQQQLGIDMRTTDHYSFRRSPSMRFRVFFGDKDEVNDKAIAEQLVFHEVYPNPAQSDVSVSFSVPGNGPVTFDVFDALGRKVWSQAGIYPRGRHEVNLSGIKPAAGSGLFIVQVSNNQSRQQKRLQIR